MKKLMIAALGFGIALSTISFAAPAPGAQQDDKKTEKKKKKKKTTDDKKM